MSFCMGMYEYRGKGKLCYMNTDSLTVCINTEDVYEHDAVEVEIRIDTSNYDIERPLLIEKINKLIRLMTGGLDWNIMTMFFGLRLKTYLYLVDDFSGDKKAKETK